MPRKALARFGHRCQPREEEEYLMRVDQFAIRDGEICCVVRHTLDAYEGQTCEIRRTLPASPDGLVAELLRACGLSVDQDSSIDPQEAIGKTVVARFGHGATTVTQIVSFKKQELNHDKTE